MSDQTKPAAELESTSSSERTDARVAQATPNNASHQTVVHQGKSGGKGLSLFAILLSLAALGGSGYNYYTTQLSSNVSKDKILTNVNDIGSNVKILAERMSQVQRSQQDLQQNVVDKSELKVSLLQASTNTDSAISDLKDQQKTLSEAVQKFTADNQRSSDKLALDEVSQLLKLANNSAVFAGNKESAINALKLADSQLKQLADPRYSVVRRKINAEISGLQAIKSADVTSISAKLSALGKQVPTLPLENEPPVASEIKIAKQQDQQEMTFTSELKKLWTDTLNSIQIKRVDQPPKPLLAPEQRYFLDQNIQLKLATAELAVMQNNADVFVRSIDAASGWLKEYYDPRNAEVTDVIAQLAALRKQPLGQELPAVAGSYDELQRIKGGN